MLIPKQLKFVEEYLTDRNAKQAAIRAGYSKRTAHSQGQRLLKRPDVKKAIEEAMAIASDRNGATVDRIVTELLAVGISDIGDILDFTGEKVRLREPHKIPDHARRAISSVKVKRRMEGMDRVEIIEFKLWDKMAALDKLGRYRGMFVDRQEITGANGGPLELLVAERIIDANDEGSTTTHDSKNDQPAPGTT